MNKLKYVELKSRLFQSNNKINYNNQLFALPCCNRLTDEV